MKIVQEFRQFIQRGNVVDLAVGLIMGAAFTKIVTSLVADIIMPPIGYLIGGVKFTDLHLELPPLKILSEKLAPATINYGTFLQNIFDFLIIAFCVFLMVKGMNRLSRKPDPTPPPPTPSVTVEDLEDPREALMDWLRDDSNPYFTKAIVNRIWAGYFNVGIVEPIDDLSLANPPSNEALLDYLATEFRHHNYDMKWLHRTIANSRTYQLSWHANSTNEFDERNFARAVPHRLPAEVAYDALQLATMNDSDAANWKTAIAGRSIGNTIVDSRAGARGKANYALSIFGRSIRDSNCDCDRSSESSLLQTVYLQNDSEVLTMIGAKGRWVDQILKSTKSAATIADDKEAKSRQAKRLAELDVVKLKQKLANAEKREKPELAEAIKKELAERERALAEANAAAPSGPALSPSDFDLPQIIKQAYLRTLSRYPTDAEIERATHYYRETDDAARGTRDLLWALVNTKEFVVNH
eukprot:TRINITY_DN220_c0_g1_i1.p2 TRINITY_DN220_c0_g1~~TRINITY_DN220_c0_g1_i1.p2  ORF type:complete len:468 (+),score=149.92 TRINITY_DN220_c0_g1_i1:1177-2580(+)